MVQLHKGGAIRWRWRRLPGKWWTGNGYGRDVVNDDGSNGRPHRRQHRLVAIGRAEAGLGSEGEESGWKCMAAEVMFGGRRTQERMEGRNARWFPISQPKNCAFPATESLKRAIEKPLKIQDSL